ncbi:WW domain-binding protein 2-like isoform X3 [Varroa jacobsoni]|nr:WW domain-binding protein 2-like isoform X2 [Varroa destructor]XP_022650904.1 WW domain-binding protein 2-like isoform X2 [Varroa destructor]XP_022702850.1 WW domain-binding protein 2-like isoform X3 [Varroa jacobsoni]
MKGTRKGRIYLTTHRMIFRSNDDSKGLVSFSFPFYTIHDLGLEQPVFGANYIKGKVKAEPGGNWTGAANFKLTFKDGGAIEYGQALIAAVQATSRYIGEIPPYPLRPPTQYPYVNAMPGAYMAPQGPAPYGFYIPTNVFPEHPPANQVYTVEQPPPYPGVMGTAGSSELGPPPAYVAPPPAYVTPNSGTAYAHASAPDQPATNRDNNQGFYPTFESKTA